MPVNFTPSADRHGISHEDAMHAILNADDSEPVAGRGTGLTMVYVGRPHPQTDRRIEVIAQIRDGRDITIFHVMEVSDLYRHLVKED